MSAGDRQEALRDVAALMRRHGLTVEEVSAALAGRPGPDRAPGGMLSRFFAYLGGIFVFAGLSAFVGMQWADLGPLSRVLLTLGAGFVLFLAGVAATFDRRLERVETPLLLVAAVLQPAGALVMLDEFGAGGELAYALLGVSVAMAIQQGCTFWVRRRTVLALTAVAFAVSAGTIALDLAGVEDHVIGVLAGVSLVGAGWWLDRSPHGAVSGIAYLAGAAALLGASFDGLFDTWFEALFVVLACGVIFLSTVVRSRMLLLVGTVALIGYLGRVIAERFADTLGAPLVLVLVGLVLIGLGTLAVRLNRTFIGRQA